MARNVKVLLIGGTSHVGKSTLAKRLAAASGWRHLSTDELARHPGRPWRADGARLPDDVVRYYSRGSADERVESVLRHYRENVWPIAEAIVRSHLNNPYDPCLVLEGSAMLPEQVHAAAFERARWVWLTAPHESIRQRIQAGSAFDGRSAGEKALIEAFLERALAFDAVVVDSCARLGERCLDAGAADAYDELAALVGAP